MCRVPDTCGDKPALAFASLALDCVANRCVRPERSSLHGLGRVGGAGSCVSKTASIGSGLSLQFGGRGQPYRGSGLGVGDWALGSGPSPGQRHGAGVALANGGSLYSGRNTDGPGRGSGGGGGGGRFVVDNGNRRDSLVEYWFGSSSKVKQSDSQPTEQLHFTHGHDDGMKLGILSRANQRDAPIDHPNCVQRSSHGSLAWGESGAVNGLNGREANGVVSGSVAGGAHTSPGSATSHARTSRPLSPLHTNSRPYEGDCGGSRKLGEFAGKARGGLGDRGALVHQHQMARVGSPGTGGGSSGGSLLDLLSSNSTKRGPGEQQTGPTDGGVGLERDVQERVAMVDAMLPSPFCTSRPLGKPIVGISLGGGWGPGGLSEVLKGKVTQSSIPIQSNNGQPTIN